MKFTMYVKDEGTSDDQSWSEGEDRPLKPLPETEEGANAWARQCIQDFNDSLRPGERPRALVRVEVTGSGTTQHQWEKISLITELGGYDRMKCALCGITGKRYGFGQTGIKRDSKYRASKYDVCTPRYIK